MAKKKENKSESTEEVVASPVITESLEEVEEETEVLEVLETSNTSTKKKSKLPSLSKKLLKTLKTDFMPTGIIGLDLAISDGKGLPIGDFVGFEAAPGVGKSTICAQVAKNLIERHKSLGIPFKVLYIDIEGSKGLLESMGLEPFVESGDLLVSEGIITFKELEETYSAIISKQEDYKDVKLVILDSITQVTTETKIENSVEKADFGLKAKACTEFLSKYVPLSKEGKITTLLINQIRANQEIKNPLYDSKTKNSATLGQKHTVSVMVRLTKKTSKSDKNLKPKECETAFGKVNIQSKYIITLSTSADKELKNRYGRIPNVDILVNYGKQVCNYFTITCLLLYRGLVKQSSNNKYYVSKEITAEGKELIFSKLKDLNKYVDEHKGSLFEYIKKNGYYKVTPDIISQGEDYE